MTAERLMTVLRYNTRVLITATAALILGLFFFLIPIEVLQLTWAKGFEVWYFRVLGAVASVTLPGAVVHFFIWDSQNSK